MAWVSSCPKTYNNIGLGRPKNAMTQRMVPREKNQNSSEAQKRCCRVAVEKLLKKARVNIQAGGTRKTAMICLSQRTGTTHVVSLSEACAREPVRSLRRLFLTVESTASGRLPTSPDKWRVRTAMPAYHLAKPARANLMLASNPKLVQPSRWDGLFSS
jgi:hypothetical protein